MIISKMKSVAEAFKYSENREILWVFILGFVIRLYACQFTFIINPDGGLYINQARTLYYGQYDTLTSCGVMKFLSNYPFLIAGAYSIFNDWIVAAKAVSLIFGFCSLIPLYYLALLFFPKRICVPILLIFGIMPVMVSCVAEVMRDPVCWFFLNSGLYFFVRQIKKKEIPALMLSGIFFLIAAWARVEAILFILISSLFILIVKSERKFYKIVSFTIPIISVIAILVCVGMHWGLSLQEYFRTDRIMVKLNETLIRYEHVRDQIRALEISTHDPLAKAFLSESGKHIWLIALAFLFKRSLEAFFHPFFLFFFIGIFGIRDKIKADPRILYFVLTAVSGIILLYDHVIDLWVMEYRFFSIVIFPSLVFAGFGIEKIVAFAKSRFGLQQKKVLLIICCALLIAGLPKNLFYKATDKIVFRQIGEYISAQQRDASLEIKIATCSLNTQRWISFYANLHHEGVSCPDNFDHQLEAFPNAYKKFVKDFRNRNFHYFLWEERTWPAKKFHIKEIMSDDFSEIGRWYHRDTGQMILFKLTLHPNS